jgi:hypothetical protein
MESSYEFLHFKTDNMNFDILKFNILTFDILMFDIFTFDILTFDKKRRRRELPLAGVGSMYSEKLFFYFLFEEVFLKIWITEHSKKRPVQHFALGPIY